jgi:hypothetical protein
MHVGPLEAENEPASLSPGKEGGSCAGHCGVRFSGCQFPDASSQSQFWFPALSSEFSDQFPVLHCVTCDNYGTVCRIEFAAHIGRSIGGLWSRLRCISPTRL